MVAHLKWDLLDIRLDQADLTVQIEQEQEEGPSTEEADAQDNDSQEDEGNGTSDEDSETGTMPSTGNKLLDGLAPKSLTVGVRFVGRQCCPFDKCELFAICLSPVMRTQS